jgi:hypothetical protein
MRVKQSTVMSDLNDITVSDNCDVHSDSQSHDFGLGYTNVAE